MHFLLHSAAGVMCHLWKALHMVWTDFQVSLPRRSFWCNSAQTLAFDILAQLCPGAGSWAISRKLSLSLTLCFSCLLLAQQPTIQKDERCQMKVDSLESLSSYVLALQHQERN